ncbi:MAG: sensor histidine kinase [Gemmatimonadales bacterium]
MPARRTWFQLLVVWVPVWGLYTSLILSAHPGGSVHSAALNGFWAIGTAALLSIGVHRLAARLPWPHPFHWNFGVIHLGASLVYAAVFAGLSTLALIAVARFSGRGGAAVDGTIVTRFFVMGVWFYVMVAAVVYATRSTARAARAEALAAESQLAALRSQLNPHFLFNALNTVVQLIPEEPGRAAGAAEQLAGLLRSAIEEDRDLVTLGEELAFVERYLDLERTRFGDRLTVRVDVPAALRESLVPAFAVQTLVENAVRHGVGPRIEPTEVVIAARAADGGGLVIEVRDSGAGDAAGAADHSTGTGLRRLRERLDVLSGGTGRLEVRTAPGAGCTATLQFPPLESD